MGYTETEDNTNAKLRYIGLTFSYRSLVSIRVEDIFARANGVIVPVNIFNQSINHLLLTIQKTNVNVTQHNMSRTERLKSTNSCPEKK